METTERAPRYRAGLPQRPDRIAALPLSKQGYPIPWFVATLEDGTRDFRIISHERLAEAVKLGRCWVCGQNLGGYKAFTIGPMCAVNRISAEPPSHRSCAQYAAVACPFLSRPEMVRRETGLEELGTVKPPGMIERNPAVALVWVCRDYAGKMTRGRALFEIGDPIALEFYHRGQPASFAQVCDSIRTGLPALLQATEHDENPAYSRGMLALELVAALGQVEKCFPGHKADAEQLLTEAMKAAGVTV